MSDKMIVVCASMKSDLDTKGMSVLDVFKTDPKIGFYATDNQQFWYIELSEKSFAEWIKVELGGFDTNVEVIKTTQRNGNRIFKEGSFLHKRDPITFYMGDRDLVLTERQARVDGSWYAGE